MTHICFITVQRVIQVEDQKSLVPINILELVEHPGGIFGIKKIPSRDVNTLNATAIFRTFKIFEFF